MKPGHLDILPEQTVALLTSRRDEIVAASAVVDPASKAFLPRDDDARRNLNGLMAASEIRDYLQAVQERLHAIESPSAGHMAKLIDKARQLEAYHLWQLDGAIPF